jgi:E3 ubiquitin-protein ligase ZSWIM2
MFQVSYFHAENEFDKLRMSRAVPWVSTPSDIVSASIESAKRKSFFILKQIGPTSFILRDGASKREQQAEGNGGSSSKNEYKVQLGAVHSCTCFGFRKEKRLCRHICWIILKKFKIPEGHPLTYQAGYVPREIDELLRGTHVQKVQKVENAEANETEAQPANQNRRELDSEDVCPICQEELLEARLPVTWCRSCSNAAHIRCMKVWSEHQDTMARGDTDTAVQCPYCRQDFAPKDHLRKEFANTWEAGKEKTAIHKVKIRNIPIIDSDF